MTKLTKTQTANLTQIWTSKVAYGAQTGTGVQRLSAAQAKSIGYRVINANAMYVLKNRGLVQSFLTTDTVLGCRVRVTVLTDAGRAAIGV